MFKYIYKMLIKCYNTNENVDVNYEVCEYGNPYGHIKEFNKLNDNVKKDAHRVISTKALKLYSKNKIYGSVVDINGNTYDFDIFTDGSYRVTGVEKIKNNIEVIADGKYFKKNS